MAGYCKHSIALAVSTKFRDLNGYLGNCQLLDYVRHGDSWLEGQINELLDCYCRYFCKLGCLCN